MAKKFLKNFFLFFPLVNFAFLLFSCKDWFIKEELQIFVTNSYAGPVVSDAEIRIVEGAFDDRGGLDDLSLSPEKIPGTLLGKTDRLGSFSFIPSETLSSSLFSIVVTKEGFGASIIQDFCMKQKAEKVEVVMQSLVGVNAKAAPIWFQQIKREGETLLKPKQFLKSHVKVAAEEIWEATLFASYPISRLDPGGIGLVMNLSQVPSALSQYTAALREEGMEKKTTEKSYEEKAYYANRYDCDLKFFLIDSELFFYLVCYDIMGNRVQMRVPVAPLIPFQKGSSYSSYLFNKIELRTFAVNRKIYSKDSSLRGTTGYLIVESEITSGSFINERFKLYMRPSSTGGEKEKLPFQLVDEVKIPKNYNGETFEAVFASSLFQPNQLVEFQIEVLHGEKVRKSLIIGPMAMLPEKPVVNYSPTNGVGVNQSLCNLEFDVENWNQVANSPFVYEFSLKMDCLDDIEMLGTFYTINNKDHFLPIQFAYIEDREGGMVGLYVYPHNLSFPDSDYFCFQKGYSRGHFSINVQDLISFLKSRNFSVKPPKNSGLSPIFFVPGTAYRWAIYGPKHGASCRVYWERPYRRCVVFSSSYSSSIETGGIGAGANAFFYIQ